MSTRIGTRRRHGLAVLALVSLATIGACHESSTGPEDPQTYDLRAHQTAMRSPSASRNGGVVQAAHGKPESSMISSTIDAIGKALSTAARK